VADVTVSLAASEVALWRSRCDGDVAHPFPAYGQEKPAFAAIGPRSNTGQKGGALVDYLTVVISETRAEERGLARIDLLLETLFQFRGRVRFSGWRDKRWQFYPSSGVLIDEAGELVGRCGRNGDSFCISISGSGCAHVKSWHACRMHLDALHARITRCDLAWDDYEGARLNVHDLRLRARAREFMQGGTPPKWRFLDDEGSGDGSTLYVGSKGHKELCIYEKGKQLGQKNSPWVRAEVRLYGKHADVPTDVLIDPLAFLRGAYDVLALLLLDVAPEACTRIKTKRRMVEASGEAMVEYLHRQVGPSLNLLLEAFGGSWADFLQHRIVRPGSPGRFRGHPKGETLAQLLREELCRSAP
jgi:phage replication initiation protein